MNHVLLFHDVVRPARQIVQLDRLYIDSQQMVDGRENLLKVDGAVFRSFSEPIGGANNLPATNSIAKSVRGTSQYCTLGDRLAWRRASRCECQETQQSLS